MENHPIPQDITGFQFKLIGDMTVKQFAYLAVGVVCGWFIMFMLPLPLIVKIPVGVIIAGLGIALAFVPFDGRPLDVMLTNFVSTLFRPNQYLFLKENSKILSIYYMHPQQVKKQNTEEHHAPKYSQDQLETYLKTLPTRRRSKYDQKELNYLQRLSTLTATLQPIPQNQVQTQPQAAPVAPQPITRPSMPVQVLKPVIQQPAPKKLEPVPVQKSGTQIPPSTVAATLDQKQAAIKQQLELAKAQEANEQNEQLAKTAHTKVTELEKLLQDTAGQKQQLEAELVALKKQLSTQKQEVFSPSTGVVAPQQTANVRTVPKDAAKSVGMPSVSEHPNVVTGIVKDARGNPLPNILIEVRDSEDNPVRAFKTNMLGTFASATPLQNGTYTIAFEDPTNTHQFDTIQIDVTGEIILPVEVISVDAREELRRSLFGDQAQT